VKYELPFPLLSDPEHRIHEAYGVWQEKTLYGKKSMGTVRTTFVIDADGRIERIFPKVKVDGHVAEVLGSL
jgi:peroxiredoxin Q/BCP